METQNISVQLFNKELPVSERAGYFGCKNDFMTNNLTTCVNYNESDANIEDAFQKQMNLAEYYKSIEIFNSMKQQFADQTMEGMNNTSENRFDFNNTNNTNNTQVGLKEPILPVVARDSLFESIKKSKETFGSSSGGLKWYWILLIILACIAFIFYTLKYYKVI